MRLMFLVNSLGRGGAERQTVDLAVALEARGHKCLLLAVKPDMSLQASAGDVPARCLGARCFLDLVALRALRAEIAAFGPELIVPVNQYALMYAHLACYAGANRPALAMTFHTTQLRTAKERFLNRFYKLLVRRTELLVFVAEAQAMFWLAQGFQARRNLTIHNGIDTVRFSPLLVAGHRTATRARHGFGEDDFVIGLCGLLRPEKNHVQLVEAVARLRAAAIPAVALMVGDGPSRPEVEVRAQALGVSGQVCITGLQTDVRPELAAFDVVTLCSTTETFSLAALEAMALGIPAVLSDVGGAREMVDDGVNGHVFPPSDLDALVTALARLYHDGRGRMAGEAARRLVVERFTHAGMVDKYEHQFAAFAVGKG